MKVIIFILLCFAAQMTVIGMFFIVLTYPTLDHLMNFLDYISTERLDAGGLFVRLDAGFFLAIVFEIIIYKTIIRWRRLRSSDSNNTLDNGQ